MKHIISSLLGCLTAITLITTGSTVTFAAGNNPVYITKPYAHYETNNTLDLCVDIITAEEAAAYNSRSISFQGGGNVKVQAGDYMLTVRITNNTGFSDTGFRIWFDPAQFDPCSYFKEKSGKMQEIPVYLQNQDVSIGHQFSVNRFADDPNQPYGIIGWGTMSAEDCMCEGALFSFFIRKKPLVPSDVPATRGMEKVSWQNASKNRVPCTIINNGYFLRTRLLNGDLDGSGRVDVKDAQIVLELSTAMLAEGINLSNFSETDQYGFDAAHMYQYTVLAGVADVNRDGMLEAADAQSILMYYTERTLTGKSMHSEIGEDTFVYCFVET